MTRIGMFSANMPIRPELGSLGTGEMAEETGSEGQSKGNTFQNFLSHLSHPVESAEASSGSAPADSNLRPPPAVTASDILAVTAQLNGARSNAQAAKPDAGAAVAEKSAQKASSKPGTGAAARTTSDAGSDPERLLVDLSQSGRASSPEQPETLTAGTSSAGAAKAVAPSSASTDASHSAGDTAAIHVFDANADSSKTAEPNPSAPIKASVPAPVPPAASGLAQSDAMNMAGASVGPKIAAAEAVGGGHRARAPAKNSENDTDSSEGSNPPSGDATATTQSAVAFIAGIVAAAVTTPAASNVPQTAQPQQAQVADRAAAAAIIARSDAANAGPADLSSDADPASGAPLKAAASDTFEMKVTSLSAETHFPPVARLSPAQQVSDALAATAASMVGRPSVPGTGASEAGGTQTAAAATPIDDPASSTSQPSASPIKTLNLQLQPETLGQVTIKLNLSDGGLTVQLEAVHQQTADLINKDKQSIVQGLSNSGYSVAGLQVTTTPQHGSHMAGDNSSGQGQANPNAGQSGSQSGHGGAPNGDRRTHEPSNFSESVRNKSSFASTEPAGSRGRSTGGSGLFI